MDDTTPPALQAGTAPQISWPGYGILFFWQLGVMQRLSHDYDLSHVDMVGSSAGSLLSVLAACGVEPQAALDLAHELCMRHKVFQRPLGLLGVWGGIVREWLDLLLPPDAADRCSGRVRIVLTTLPWFQRQLISHFTSRADLIDCCLASSHVPFVMDGVASARFRGRACVDGSLLYILTRRCHVLRPTHRLSQLLLFDPWSDTKLLQGGWNVLRCVLLCGKAGAQQLLDMGDAYAAAMDAAGGLQLLQPFRRCEQGQEQEQEHGGLRNASHHPHDASTHLPHGGVVLEDDSCLGRCPALSPSGSSIAGSSCSSMDVLALIADDADGAAGSKAPRPVTAAGTCVA